MNILKKISILIIICIILLSLSVNTLARDNFALGVGTIDNKGITTTQDVEDALTVYLNAGYNVYGVADPGLQHFWEQLYADIQFFSSHGDVNSITFKESGIVAGNTRYYNEIPCIGTNIVNWGADTILVIYSSCESAGTNGVASTNSIAYKTALRGSEVVIGWRSAIQLQSARIWTQCFNLALGSGDTVLEAMDFANSFSYADPNVRENSTIFYYGDGSTVITGRYRNNNSINRNLVEQYDERKLVGKNKNNKEIYNIETVEKIIKEKYNDFDISNYSITEGTSLAINMDTGKQEETNYLRMNLKLGDFETLSGFVIKVKDNLIEEIYDNTINAEKEKKILEEINTKKINMSVELDNNIKNIMKEVSKIRIKMRYNDIKIDDSNIEYKYRYDINTDKKYIVFNIESVTKAGTKAIDTIEYEI